ncbi:MAG: hypothetical protein OEO71_12380 [Gammaproteobacteria bacterium]|nr:hypothetical protein [Gammaproteobacteria bacterium]
MDRPVVQEMTDTVIPVPLVIAVSGHRNLVAAEIPEIERLVREFLETIRGNSGETPVAVLTPLAEGAGQLVATEALRLGLPLIVPLPMPRDLYRQSLASDADRQEFDTLVSQAEVFELPLVEGNTRESIAQPGPARDKQYAQLGVYLSGHCHLLLAIWDGKDSDRLGGTAQVVHYHHTDYMPGLTTGRSHTRHLIADYESDLIYQIVCSRDQADGAPVAGLQSLQTFYLTADPDNPRTKDLPTAYRLMFRRTCEFNRDALRYHDRIARHESTLLAEAKAIWPSARLLKIATLFRTADWLARQFQVRVDAILRGTYTLAALMGLAFIAYADVNGLDYMIYVFLILFAIGFALYLIAAKRDWQRKYLDYRSLAEGLRVQFYWLMAGVSSQTDTEFAHDNFLQKQDVELGWIRNVMRAATIGQPRDDKTDVESGLEYAISHWIGDANQTNAECQIAYFGHRKETRLLVHRITATLGYVCLWTGIAITLFLAIFSAWLSEGSRTALLVLMGILPLAAAVREAYAHKKADKELIKQYRFMHRLFSNARTQLDAARTNSEKREVLRALGDAALDEHAEWILMHRERPLEHGWL